MPMPMPNLIFLKPLETTVQTQPEYSIKFGHICVATQYLTDTGRNIKQNLQTCILESTKFQPITSANKQSAYAYGYFQGKIFLKNKFHFFLKDIFKNKIFQFFTNFFVILKFFFFYFFSIYFYFFSIFFVIFFTIFSIFFLLFKLKNKNIFTIFLIFKNSINL